MDQISQVLNQTFTQTGGQGLIHLVWALVILLVGWIIAAIVARVTRSLLGKLRLDERVGQATGSAEEDRMPITSWIGTGVFWLIMLFFIMGALETLGLMALVAPLNALLNELLALLPMILAAAILALVAHVIGSIARKIVTSFVSRRKVDQKLTESSGTQTSIATPLGDAAYYLVWLFFLPAILGALNMQSVLVPVQNMIDQFLSFLPFLAAAAILLVVGWFAARIIQRVVEGFLASAGVDNFADRVGISRYMGGLTISHLLGIIVFVVVLVPVVTAALDALNLESLTAPLTAMLNEVLTAIPSYIAAVAILVLTYVIARWLLGIGVEIMTGFGVNKVPQLLGLSQSDSIGGRTLAQWIGDVALLVLMLLATVQAAQVVGWTAVTVAVGRLGTQIVQVVFGLAIIAFGLYLANLAARFVLGSNLPNKRLLAAAARITVVVFVGAMGLAAMGVAEEIVVLAFGLFFGAIAIAVALAFGLGGRESAARAVETWTATLETKGE